ncbi:MAG: TonB-dependent receptor, partial [Bacteroidia bacterium]|nr:TonB-dependent receptor [Bacteroidia bacterium]
MRFIFTLLFFLAFKIGFSQSDTLSTKTNDDSTEVNTIPVFSVGASDNGTDNSGQDIAGLLQSSKDVFNYTAGFNLFNGRFRIRGMMTDNTTVLINGVKVNDPESGIASWTNWGGLNDVTRGNVTVSSSLSANRTAFGDIGGATNIQTRASEYRKGTRVSYALTNRNFNHRIMVTHSTGLMKNGWSFTVSGSRRYSQEGYVEGTYFDSWSYFLSAEKKLNDKHSLGFTFFGAPIEQGRQSGAVQETFDLAGSNYYNPNWGYQEGKKRNARVSYANKPMALLTHFFKPNTQTTIQTSVFYSQGSNSLTGLNWYDAPDPRPDYYRYLPSYYKDDQPMFDSLTKSWQTDVNTRQINWDKLYQSNYNNWYSLQNANGVAGNTVLGKRARYIIEDARNDYTQKGINSIINKSINDHLFLSGGINLYSFTNHYYKVVSDLLGADYWVDVDAYAERTNVNDSLAQNDLKTFNKIVKKGDKFGYDYNINSRNGDGFIQAEYTIKRFELYAGLSLAYTEFWRTGNMQNGRFPNNSLGDSKKLTFLNYGYKGGVTYKITGRHIVTTNFGYLTKSPNLNNVYISPRTRDFTVDNPSSERNLSADINYVVRLEKLKLRASVYHAEINNQIWLRTFYHDELKTFVNYTLTGLNQTNEGGELGADYKLRYGLSLVGVLSKGYYIYTSRPHAVISSDNSAQLIAKDRLVYLKNYRVGGIPQTAG